jgi:hypothetical protein
MREKGNTRLCKNHKKELKVKLPEFGGIMGRNIRGQTCDIVGCKEVWVSMYEGIPLYQLGVHQYKLKALRKEDETNEQETWQTVENIGNG